MQVYRSGLVDSVYRVAVNLKGGPAMPVEKFLKVEGEETDWSPASRSSLQVAGTRSHEVGNWGPGGRSA